MTVKIGNYNISDQDFKAYVDKNANNPAQLHSDLTSIGGTAKELANAYNQVYGGNLTDAQLSNYLQPSAASTPTVTPHTTTPTVTPHITTPTVTPHTTGSTVNPVSPHPVAASSGLLSSPPRSSSNDLFSQFGFTPQQFKDYLNTGVSPSQIQSDAAKVGISDQQLTDMYNQAYGLTGSGALTVSGLNDYFNGGTNNDSNQKTPEQLAWEQERQAQQAQWEQEQQQWAQWQQQQADWEEQHQTPTDEFSSKYGFTADDFKNYISGATPSDVQQEAQNLGYSNQDMADMYNQAYGTHITASQVADYYTSGQNQQQPSPTNSDPFSRYNFSMQDFKDVLGTASPSDFQKAAQYYGLDNQALADLYNYAYNGNITAADVQDYFTNGEINKPGVRDTGLLSNNNAASFLPNGNYNTTNVNTNQAPVAMPSNANFKPSGDYTAANVNTNTQTFQPVATVADRLQGLLAQDNPYIQQARQTSMEQSNARGNLNSSIAAGAGERAAIQAALPIAQQDAQTANQYGLNTQTFNYSAALQNAQAENALKQQAMQGDYSLANTGYSGAIQQALSKQNFGYNAALENSKEQNALTQQRLQGDYNLANTGYSGNIQGLLAQQQQGYDLDKLQYQKDINEEIQQQQGQIDANLNRINADSKTRAQVMESTGKIHQQYLEDKMQIITNSDLDPMAKEKYLQTLTDNYTDAINNTLFLSGFNFSIFTPSTSSGSDNSQQLLPVSDNSPGNIIPSVPNDNENDRFG